MKSRKLIMTISLMAIAMLASAVFATWFLTRPVSNTGHIIAFNDVQVYSDSGCTTPLTTLTWPSDMMRNHNYTWNVWIKNLGDSNNIWISWNSTGLATGLTTYMTNATADWREANAGQSLMPKGAVWACEYKLVIGGTAAINVDVSWTLYVYAEI